MSTQPTTTRRTGNSRLNGIPSDDNGAIAFTKDPNIDYDPSSTFQGIARTPVAAVRDQLDALGRIARNFRMLANKFRGAWRPALRKWFLTITWPVQLKYGELLCILNRHQDEEAPAVDKNGDFLPELPGRYSQCRRPKCQRIRGRVTLLETDRVCEVPDLTVIAWKNCKKCGGRGYGAKMLMGPGNQGKQTRAKQPCDCLQIQPAFLEHIEGGKC